MVKINSYYTDM